MTSIELFKNVTLGGEALKNYFPTAYLKGKPYLFNIEQVTFNELLYLAMLDKKGMVTTSIAFRKEFLQFLFKNNIHFVALKKLNEQTFVIYLKSFIKVNQELSLSKFDYNMLN
tara:strand:+ start:1764 stop:2102 length:339 start_codon:yes stop_codon:yes gene_type:complete